MQSAFKYIEQPPGERDKHKIIQSHTEKNLRHAKSQPRQSEQKIQQTRQSKQCKMLMRARGGKVRTRHNCLSPEYKTYRGILEQDGKFIGQPEHNAGGKKGVDVQIKRDKQAEIKKKKQHQHGSAPKETHPVCDCASQGAPSIGLRQSERHPQNKTQGQRREHNTCGNKNAARDVGKRIPDDDQILHALFQRIHAVFVLQLFPEGIGQKLCITRVYKSARLVIFMSNATHMLNCCRAAVPSATRRKTRILYIVLFEPSQEQGSVRVCRVNSSSAPVLVRYEPLRRILRAFSTPEYFRVLQKIYAFRFPRPA